jgi:hypothetical protein
MAVQSQENPETLAIPATPEDILNPDSVQGKDPLPFHFILPCSEQEDSVAWKFTTSMPARNWFMEEFDDSGWNAGIAGFGNPGRDSLSSIGTTWDTCSLWMRQEFELDLMPEGQLYFNIRAHNTVSSIYVNGKKLGVFTPTGNIYEMIDFNTMLKEVLKPGSNTIAVYSYARVPPIDNSKGLKRQLIDVGIIEVID